ncbi:Crp/Fnr family transcriptional regulator [Mucilaginibacter hurinus]|uniref:Crp/Fnr family transcriptional regulator n=1 Tax=Mucilaginibacter hurinus TaxID=2201324 RepID=UPI001314B96B|nr:cyclic nucleotide-binding domain-containing protein [Mucilaginibacter hurinus]
MKINSAIPHPEELAQLKAYFNYVPVLSDAFFEAMLARWYAFDAKRKTLLTSEDDIERYLYFVIKGVQRCYCTHVDKEVTIVFTYPYSFAGVVDSFLLCKPANSNFETLTASRLLRISYRDFMQLADDFPELEKWLRIMSANALSSVLERQKELSIFSATEKLEVLFKRSPHLFNLIPDKYIASYIGVDKATLSKMLNKIRL